MGEAVPPMTTTTIPTCPVCGAETFGSTVPGAVYCPHCGADVTRDISKDDTIRVPVDVMRAKFAVDSTMPPPPLDSDELDEDVPPSVPTRPETPNALRHTIPPEKH
jgi:uncharacterized Zn finger protein (UPF0148 family)